ncbi:MAG: hypothetical protein IJ706_01825, partial [Clostridia bacterium]|nr:hypothetical protein [Clostridia bacterium]
MEQKRQHKTAKIVVAALFALVMTLALAIGMLPKTGLTVYAVSDPYADLVPTGSEETDALTAKQVTFNGNKWYIIKDESQSATVGTLTLLYADASFGKSIFDTSSAVYGESEIKGKLDALTDTNGDFSSIADAINDTDNGKIYLLSTDEAEAVPLNVRKYYSSEAWWLRTQGDAGKVTYVYVTHATEPGKIVTGGVTPNYAIGVRPALQLDLSKVDYDAEKMTFTVKTEVIIEKLAQDKGIDLKDYNLIPAEDMYLTFKEYWVKGTARGRAVGDDNEYRVATRQFTINGLPKESVIFCKAYFVFETLAWSDTKAQSVLTGKKLDKIAKIEDLFDWWENYTLFGFNLTKYAEGDFNTKEKTDAETLTDAFRIYVPKTEDVAEVNGTSYQTIADAIRAASAGQTVKLLKDTQESVTLKAGDDIILDLNGFKLTNDGKHSTIVAQTGSTVVVTGPGTVDNTTNQCAPLFNNGGTVTLNGGIFTRSLESGKEGGNTYYTVVNRGTMTINEGVTISNDNPLYNYSSLIANGYNEYTRTGYREIDSNISFGYVEGESAANPTLTINGGTFKGGNQVLKNDVNGIATVSGGDFSSSTGNAIKNLGELTISGGTFTAQAEGKFVLFSAAESGKTYGPEFAYGTATVTGGTFNGKLQKDEGATIAISGGEFSEIVPEDCCADGYQPVTTKNENEKYSVITDIEVVSALIENIGEITYSADCKKTLDEAMAAYNLMSKEQQDAIEDYYYKLVDAINAYNMAKIDFECAFKATAYIDFIGEVEYSVACRNAIANARKIYNSLTASQKAYVGNYETLTAA